MKIRAKSGAVAIAVAAAAVVGGVQATPAVAAAPVSGRLVQVMVGGTFRALLPDQQRCQVDIRLSGRTDSNGWTDVGKTQHCGSATLNLWVNGAVALDGSMAIDYDIWLTDSIQSTMSQHLQFVVPRYTYHAIPGWAPESPFARADLGAAVIVN